jgi:diguanylate cyclase (GGDEF)-like protein/PAS domain S-box-containing protein
MWLMDYEQDFYKNLLDNLYDGVYFMDSERMITYWNQGAERLTGYGTDEVVGCYCREHILEHVDEEGNRLCESSLCPAAKTIGDGEAREEEVYLHHKSGHRVPVSIRVAPIKGPEGAIIGAVEVFSDASFKINARHTIEELQMMALLDSLTGVGNRRYAEMNLKFRLAELDRYGWPFGVLFLDLDNFKDINDAYGHEVGDDLLKMAAKTFSNSLRSFDTVCRWGGEEFVAVIVNIDSQRLPTVGEKLRAMIERSSIKSDARIVGVTISIGATIAREGDSVESLMRRADECMYRSKSDGRNRVTLG